MDFQPIRELFRIKGDCGYPASAMTPWVERYGGVPQVLRDYYTSLGAHKGLNQTQDALVIPDTDEPAFYRLSNYLRDGYLVFYVENQAGVIWGVKADDVDQSDPPVYQSYDTGEDDWGQITGSVSHFIRAQAHMQSAFNLPYSSEEFWEITADQLAVIADRFPSRGADSDLWTGMRFFGDWGSLIMVMREGDHWGMLFGSDDEEDYGVLEAGLGEIVTGAPR
jgi:hypothetical protein